MDRLEPGAPTVIASERLGRVRGTSGPILFVVAALLATLLPLRAAAHGGPDERRPHALVVAVAFPDAGLTAGETLCVALFAGDQTSLTSPTQSHCLVPGGAELRFDGLTHGPYTLVVLAPGSVVAENRYQGQIISTGIPNEPERAEYALPVTVGLAPEVSGATGRVQVSVFGCPPGTDAGADATEWLDACDVLANDVPVSLSGIGSIDDTANQAVTGQDAARPGRADFSDLPPGDYEIQDALPVEAPPAAVFVESSIDGSVTPLDPNEPLALRPTEVKSVAYFVVIEPDPPPAAEDPVEDADAAIGTAGDLGADSTSGNVGIDAAPEMAPTPTVPIPPPATDAPAPPPADAPAAPPPAPDDPEISPLPEVTPMPSG